MIVYSVRIAITRPARRAALLRYLRTRHVPDLLAQPGFLSAELRWVNEEIGRWLLRAGGRSRG